MVHLLLHYLDDRLQESCLFFGRAVEGVLVELDRHGQDCLLEVLSKLLLCFTFFRLTKMAESSWYVGFQKNLDLLDFLRPTM